MKGVRDPLSVLAFGEILWDIIDGKKYLGGAPLNFAAHVVKCGGWAAAMAAVGSDTPGKDAVKKLTALGVNPSFVQVHENKPTGTVDVFLSDGQPDYIIHEDVAFDFILEPNLAEISRSNFNTFYFGSLSQRSETNRRTLEWVLKHGSFEHIFYDINLRKNYYSLEIVQYSLQHCTIFKINDDEVKIISKLFYACILSVEEFARRVADDFKISVVIITAGARGCCILSSGKFNVIPAVATTVVDTVGAGDAFSAAFMYHYFKSENTTTAALAGNRIGSYVASQHGAIPAYSEEMKRSLS